MSASMANHSAPGATTNPSAAAGGRRGGKRGGGRGGRRDGGNGPTDRPSVRQEECFLCGAFGHRADDCVGAVARQLGRGLSRARGVTRQRQGRRQVTQQQQQQQRQPLALPPLSSSPDLPAFVTQALINVLGAGSGSVRRPPRLRRRLFRALLQQQQQHLQQQQQQQQQQERAESSESEEGGVAL